jgi:Putative rRNA methylase
VNPLISGPFFRFFCSHLHLAHLYWKSLVNPGDTVVDATCGKGRDTLVLARLTLNSDIEGRVLAIDLQPQAIAATRNYLTAALSEKCLAHVHLIQGCHSTFPQTLTPESIKLIVYNLGYLPGGSKMITTRGETTLLSLASAIPLIQAGGAISVMCYPGHTEGKREAQMVQQFASTLEPSEWSCYHHHWANRSLSPSLMLMQRKLILP